MDVVKECLAFYIKLVHCEIKCDLLYVIYHYFKTVKVGKFKENKQK